VVFKWLKCVNVLTLCEIDDTSGRRGPVPASTVKRRKDNSRENLRSGSRKVEITRRGLLKTGLLGATVLVATGNGTAIALAECIPTTFDIHMGRDNTIVGTVTITNDPTNIYVQYNVNVGLTGGLAEVHVWVGSNFDTLSGNGTGRPPPGQLPYKYSNLGCVSSYTVIIPRVDANIIDQGALQCGRSIYVVAHAALCNGETAFGGTTSGPPTPGANANNAWWWYGRYIICCDTTTENGDPACQTAFGYGTHVFTTDQRSNPQGLPSLRLSKNRWGWAYNFVAPTTEPIVVPLIAGAGLNLISNGTAVGTVSYEWTGAVLTVTYNVTVSGYWLTSIHIYAGDNKPTTAAPGQYTFLQDFPTAVKQTSFTKQFDVSNTGPDGIWAIAHSVVCHFVT
jgi:hypothetical protein